MDQPKANDKVEQILLEAINVANELTDSPEAVAANPGALVLIGPGAAWDSMGFVNFASVIEERMEKDFGVSLVLADRLSNKGDIVTVADVRDLLHCLIAGQSTKS